MNMHIQVFVWMYILNSLGYIPRSGIAGSYDNSMFHILRNGQPNWLYHSTFPPTMFNGLQFLNIFTNTCYCLCLYFYYNTHPSRCEVVSHCGFDFQLSNDVEHLCIFFLTKQTERERGKNLTLMGICHRDKEAN